MKEYRYITLKKNNIFGGFISFDKPSESTLQFAIPFKYFIRIKNKSKFIENFYENKEEMERNYLTLSNSEGGKQE